MFLDKGMSKEVINLVLKRHVICLIVVVFCNLYVFLNRVFEINHKQIDSLLSN